MVVVDTAHGHSRNVVETVKEIKRQWSIQVIAGNVATAEGARDLIEVQYEGLSPITDPHQAMQPLDGGFGNGKACAPLVDQPDGVAVPAHLLLGPVPQHATAAHHRRDPGRIDDYALDATGRHGALNDGALA